MDKWLWLRAVAVLGGGSLAAYSLATDFFGFPPIGDWRYGVFFGFFAFTLGILAHIIRLQKKIAKLENREGNENKELDIDIRRDDWSSETGEAKAVRFKLTNREGSAIVNCVAKISEFIQSTGEMKSLTVPVLLSFNDSADGITIQREGHAILNLAKSRRNEIGFEIMKYPNSVKRPVSQNSIAIKINGRVGGIDRKPKLIIGRLSAEKGREVEFVE